MKRLFAVIGLALLGGCPDAAQSADAGVAVDAAAALSGCLEQPTALPRPPGATLPCELIPPSVILNSAAR